MTETPRDPLLAMTEEGAALMAWAQSDARPITDYGFDSVEEAVVLIERAALATPAPTADEAAALRDTVEAVIRRDFEACYPDGAKFYTTADRVLAAIRRATPPDALDVAQLARAMNSVVPPIIRVPPHGDGPAPGAWAPEVAAEYAAILAARGQQ